VLTKVFYDLVQRFVYIRLYSTGSREHMASGVLGIFDCVCVCMHADAHVYDVLTLLVSHHEGDPACNNSHSCHPQMFPRVIAETQRGSRNKLVRI